MTDETTEKIKIVQVLMHDTVRAALEQRLNQVGLEMVLTPLGDDGIETWMVVPSQEAIDREYGNAPQ